MAARSPAPPSTRLATAVLVALAILVLAVPLYFAGTGAWLGWRTLSALRTSVDDEGGRTRARVFHGVVVKSPPTVPAAAAGRAGWMAHVGRRQRVGKSTQFQTYCIVTRMDGLVLEDPVTHE